MPGFELIGKEEQKAVTKVFTKENGILPRYGLDVKRKGIFMVRDFEHAFAKKLGVNYAHAVTSGTSALKVALKALGVKPDDEVITQSFTFVATVEAIIDAGAIPVITEVNETFNMDPEDLKKKITRKTKAIIPVHMLGVPCQMDKIMPIGKKYKLPVLEDACEALGGTHQGKSLGTIGDIGVFSFDFGKTITTGEGGMVVSNKKDLYDLSREYADHGHQNNPKLPRAKDSRRIGGFNFRMMELQGALGLAQLKKLNLIITKQKEHKSYIKNHIKRLSNVELRQVPDEKGDCGDTLIFFFDHSEKAEKFVEKWQEKGYNTKNVPDAITWHYAGTWTHMLSPLQPYRGKDLMKLWPRSTDLLSRAVALPIMVRSTKSQLTRMTKTIIDICSTL